MSESMKEHENSLNSLSLEYLKNIYSSSSFIENISSVFSLGDLFKILGDLHKVYPEPYYGLNTLIPSKNKTKIEGFENVFVSEVKDHVDMQMQKQLSKIVSNDNIQFEWVFHSNDNEPYYSVFVDELPLACVYFHSKEKIEHKQNGHSVYISSLFHYIDSQTKFLEIREKIEPVFIVKNNQQKETMISLFRKEKFFDDHIRKPAEKIMLAALKEKYNTKNNHV